MASQVSLSRRSSPLLSLVVVVVEGASACEEGGRGCGSGRVFWRSSGIIGSSVEVSRSLMTSWRIKMAADQ